MCAILQVIMNTRVKVSGEFHPCRPRNNLTWQILMSVLLVLITVHLMLPALTFLGTSPVPVSKDTLEMESRVMVSPSPHTQNS